MPRAAHASDLASVASLYHTVWHETHAHLMPERERQRRTIALFIELMTRLLPTTLVEENDGALAGFVS